MIPRRASMAPDAAAAEERDLFTVEQFCKRHGISRAFLWRLRKEGRGPAIVQLGSRILISREAAARWRAEREAESNAR